MSAPINSKHALQSTTIQGILVMIVSSFLPIVMNISPEESTAHSREIVEAVCLTVTAFAALWAARGRKDASSSIHFGRNPNKVASNLTPEPAPSPRIMVPMITGYAPDPYFNRDDVVSVGSPTLDLSVKEGGDLASLDGLGITDKFFKEKRELGS